MKSVADYQKITLLTDLTNPDESLMTQIENMGETVCRIDCDDGFVFLIKVKEESFNALIQEDQTPQA